MGEKQPILDKFFVLRGKFLKGWRFALTRNLFQADLKPASLLTYLEKGEV